MTVLDDPTLSYKAIGLYTQLQNTPDDFSLTLDYLVEIHADDKESVVSAIDELHKAGWLRVGFMKRDGKPGGYFWQILTKEASR